MNRKTASAVVYFTIMVSLTVATTNQFTQLEELLFMDLNLWEADRHTVLMRYAERQELTAEQIRGHLVDVVDKVLALDPPDADDFELLQRAIYALEDFGGPEALAVLYRVESGVSHASTRMAAIGGIISLESTNLLSFVLDVSTNRPIESGPHRLRMYEKLIRRLRSDPVSLSEGDIGDIRSWLMTSVRNESETSSVRVIDEYLVDVDPAYEKSQIRRDMLDAHTHCKSPYQREYFKSELESLRASETERVPNGVK